MVLTLGVFEYYVCFSVTTALCMVFPTQSAFRLNKELGGITPDLWVFYGISFPVWVVFSPIFFIIFIFLSDEWKEAVLAFLSTEEK